MRLNSTLSVARSSSKNAERHMTQAEGPLNKSTILGLAAMALAVLVVANDFTALSVALPAMVLQEAG
jgi:hypothetical protein